jgi:hypothetical protein
MGGLKEDRDALLKAAGGFEGVAAEFTRAHGLMQKGESRGSEFGLLATSAGIGTAHDEFVSDMVTALNSGMQAMKDISQALIDTAKDFGATDTAVADTFHNPDGTPL